MILTAGLMLSSGSALAAVGDITEYPIPTTLSIPEGITAGPDGNLWFTELGANQVAKVTTAGAITEYPIPTASSGPGGIAAGSDGNLWSHHVHQGGKGHNRGRHHRILHPQRQ
jgi:virginiamycin B lyase